MGCQHSTPIPRSHDFEYHLPRPTNCLSDTVRPHMYPGQSLDLQFGVLNSHEYCRHYRTNRNKSSSSTNNTNNINNTQNTQTRILASDSFGEQRNHLIGTLQLEVKEMDGEIIHTKFILRDGKGKLAAIIKQKTTSTTTSYEIYSVRPRYSQQIPTWAYHDMAMYLHGCVTSVEGSSLQYQWQGTNPTDHNNNNNNMMEEIYTTHEVGSRMTRLRKMTISDNNQEQQNTRAFAVQQCITPSRYVGGRGQQGRQRVPSCAIWRLAVGPSTDPFLMIAFVVCMEQLRTTPKPSSSSSSKKSSSSSSCCVGADDQIIEC